MAEVGYIRVSTWEQNGARQLRDVNLDKVFEDHCSGKDTERPGWRACREYLREGDTLHVHSIDRLGRSLSDLTRVVDELAAAGIGVRFHKEGLFFPAGDSGRVEPMARLQFQMLAAFAEFERALIRERQREGIVLAQEAGKYRGRRSVITPARREQARELLAQGLDKTEVARRLGIGRTSLYKLLKGSM